jgi:hypothetical protein
MYSCLAVVGVAISLFPSTTVVEAKRLKGNKLGDKKGPMAGPSGNDNFGTGTIIGDAITSCFNNSDCSKEQYCSQGACLAHGDCTTDMDCINPSNWYPVIECTGPLSCDAGKCGRTCGPTCPDGSDGVTCEESPCEVTAMDDDCLAENPTSCVNDYCGGCNAIRFNAMGSQVCNKKETAVTLPSPSCSSDSDCQGDEYCSDGTCRVQGECGDVVDCFNPSNVFATIACVGPLTCEQGMCGRVCAESSCADGSEPVMECRRAPCNETLATGGYDCLEGEAPVSCVDDYCGGCTTLYFNAMGSQICKTPTAEILPVPSCTSNKDCQEDEYCSSGACLAQGDCTTDFDCINPSNSYPVIECTGPLSCNADGKCGRTCGPFCPDGSNGETCAENPCSIKSDDCLAETPVSCVEDNCGGCHAIRFNAMGSQVCRERISAITLPSSCKSDSDCQEDEYCSDGTVCLRQGECGALADCLNPSNIYATVMCVGDLTCDEQGMCGIVCSGGDNP